MTAPRTQRRIQDARDRVAEAAWQLLDDRAWAAITVADICERADVAPRSFHRWFPDKAELLFADAGRHEQELAAALERHPLDPHRPGGFLLAVLADMAALVEPYGPDALARRHAVIAEAPELAARELTKRDRLQLVAELGLASRLGAGDEVRARALAAVAMQSFAIGMDEWSRRGGSLDHHVRVAFAAGQSAFGAPPAV